MDYEAHTIVEFFKFSPYLQHTTSLQQKCVAWYSFTSYHFRHDRNQDQRQDPKQGQRAWPKTRPRSL